MEYTTVPWKLANRLRWMDKVDAEALQAGEAVLTALQPSKCRAMIGEML